MFTTLKFRMKHIDKKLSHTFSSTASPASSSQAYPFGVINGMSRKLRYADVGQRPTLTLPLCLLQLTGHPRSASTSVTPSSEGFTTAKKLTMTTSKTCSNGLSRSGVQK